MGKLAYRFGNVLSDDVHGVSGAKFADLGWRQDRHFRMLLIQILFDGRQLRKISGRGSVIIVVAIAAVGIPALISTFTGPEATAS